MPKRRVKRWRGYLIRLKETENEEEKDLAEYWKKARFVLAKSPKDALERLGSRVLTSGSTYAKVEVQRMSDGDSVPDTHYGRTRTFQLFFDRTLRRIDKAR